MRLLLGGLLVLAATVTLVGATADAADENSMAAAEDRLPAEPLVGAWTTAVNGDRVHDLLREDDVLWAATEGGVVRWDLASGTFEQHVAPQDGLPSNVVRALERDGADALWAGTDRGLAVLAPDATRWEVVPTPAGMPAAPSVTALASSWIGTMWVGFEQRWEPQGVHPVTGEVGAFLGGGVASLDPMRRTWSRRVWTAGDGDEADGLLPSDNVTALLVGPEGRVWVGTRPAFVWNTEACGSPSCPPDFGVWLPAGGGLAAVAPSGGAAASWAADDGPVCVSGTINGLALDGEGRMWAATGGRGLQAFLAGSETVACGEDHVVLRRRDGLPANTVWSVTAAPDGRVLAGVGDADEGLGVAVLDHGGTLGGGRASTADDTWAQWFLDGLEGQSDALPTTLALGPDGGLLVGTRDDRNGDGWGIKHRRPDGAWDTLATAPDGLPSNEITAVAARPARGEVWLGTAERGLARWDGATWTTWRAFVPQPPAATISGTLSAGADALLLALDADAYRDAFPGPERLARLGPDPTLYVLGPPVRTADSVRVSVTPPVQFGQAAGAAVRPLHRQLAGDAVTDITFDDAGRVWVAARATRRFADEWRDGGVSAFADGVWTIHRAAPEAAGRLPSPDVQSLAVDTGGQVWAGTGDIDRHTGAGVAVWNGDHWTTHAREDVGVAFGGNGVADIDVDPVTGNVWLATHPAVGCPLPSEPEGSCERPIGGGVSRWDGRGWARWAAGDGPRAFGEDGGEFTALRFDRGRGRVWVGAWAAEPDFHWREGRGQTAVLNACPRGCSAESWTHRAFPDDGVLTALALDDQGRLWAGTSRGARGKVPAPGGVKVLHGDHWRRHTRASAGLPADAVTTLAADGDGMWVGTLDGGAARWRPVELQPRGYLPLAGAGGPLPVLSD